MRHSNKRNAKRSSNKRRGNHLSSPAHNFDCNLLRLQGTLFRMVRMQKIVCTFLLVYCEAKIKVMCGGQASIYTLASGRCLPSSRIASALVRSYHTKNQIVQRTNEQVNFFSHVNSFIEYPHHFTLTPIVIGAVYSSPTFLGEVYREIDFSVAPSDGCQRRSHLVF